MEYFLITAYAILFVSMMVMSGYNFIFNQRTKIAEKKLGIHIPKFVMGLLNLTTALCFILAIIFSTVIIFSLI